MHPADITLTSIPIQRKGTSGYACLFPFSLFFPLILPASMRILCQTASRHSARNSPVKALSNPSTTPHAAVSLISPPPIPPAVIPAMNSGRHTSSPAICSCPGGSRPDTAIRHGIQSGIFRLFKSEAAARNRNRKNKINLAICSYITMLMSGASS